MEGVVDRTYIKAQHSKQVAALRVGRGPFDEGVVVFERRVDKDEDADWLEPALRCDALC
jgi:hypothetical protein